MAFYGGGMLSLFPSRLILNFLSQHVNLSKRRDEGLVAYHPIFTSFTHTRPFDFQDLQLTHALPPAIFGPVATTWFGFLQRRVVFPGRPNLEILARVGLDQTVLATTNLFVFLNTMALLEGTSASEKLEKTYWPALSRNWMVWPFVQFINFKYVPLDLRVLVVNVVSLGWNCYLSYLNSAGGTGDDEEPPFA